ncbi:MAG TPA: hypothetical protein VG694_01645 [Candidatus Paceibacterota bacterium]|jgi:hypothetical protein|nr:hypothetical protein [Candidatus Paceibacterota bacterium]
MDTIASFPKIAIRIIKEQALIIGPLAWDEAKKAGIQIIDIKKEEIIVGNGDPKGVIDRLVTQYERIFGKASHEVCRDAVRDIIAELPPEEVPSSLK